MQALRQPFNEYAVIREKAANQKRDVNRALTQFIAKTGKTHNLFRDEKQAYPCEFFSSLNLLHCAIVLGVCKMSY